MRLRTDFRRPLFFIVLAAILARYTVVDVSIHDPPLDQMIAKVFEQGVPSTEYRVLSTGGGD